MQTTPIINKIDKGIMAFVNQMTEPYKDSDDMKMFYDILHGKRFPEGTVCLKLRIGSSKRLKMYYGKNIASNIEERLDSLINNEFKIHARITSKSFHLMATIFHNENNQIEGMRYNIDSTINSGMPSQTWVVPEGDYIYNPNEINGRKLEIFFGEICKLHKLDCGVRTNSELESSKEVQEIKKRFDELMKSSADEEIDWAISNELETEEKISVLQNLSSDRKLQILQNLTNENIN